MAETRLAEGNRGGSALIHDGYKYQKNKKRNGFIYWRCWRKECRTSLKTDVLRVLKDQLVVNEAKKNGMLNGNPPPPRKLKCRRLEERIVQLKREYGNGQRNLTNYWNAICHCTAQFAA